MTASYCITNEKLRRENKDLRRKLYQIYFRRFYVKASKYLKILLWSIVEILAELFLDRRGGSNKRGD